MPMHNWKKVEPGIFHAFHQGWIIDISKALNQGVLPKNYYALPEQQAAGFGPDVLTLQDTRSDMDDDDDDVDQGGGVATAAALQTRPKTRFMAESEVEFYRRKKSVIAVRHVSDDRTVAMIEIVSPGNKAGKKAFKAFVDKACDLLEHRIHLLLIDPFPPTKRDPNGIHGEIWDETEDESWEQPADKPLTLVAYECDLTTRAYIEPIAVGDKLPDMPLFLTPNWYVNVPLEATYQSAFAAMPGRWRKVLESAE